MGLLGCYNSRPVGGGALTDRSRLPPFAQQFSVTLGLQIDLFSVIPLKHGGSGVCERAALTHS